MQLSKQMKFLLWSFIFLNLKHSLNQLKFEQQNSIVIELHFKQMLAKGPNMLNLANYTQGIGQDYHYNPDQDRQIPEQQAKSMEQRFDQYVKDLQRNQQILAKVAKSIDQVSCQEQFITDFYPQFALMTTYESDNQKRIIADTDPQLSKVVQNLQRNNKNLKQQYKGWLFEYAKKTRLSEVLLSQNKLLRKYISTKNKDIIKLIESIKNTQNQQLNLLNQNLNELREQNGLLLDHLKAIKQTLHQKQDQQVKLANAYKIAEQQKLELQGKVQKGDDEEEHYSKSVTLLQTSIQDLKRRQKKLEQQKTRLQKLLKQYKKDEQQINNQIDQCNIDRRDIENHLKTKFKDHQSEKDKLINEIEQYTQKIQKIKEQTNKHTQNIQRIEYKTIQYTKFCTDMDSKLDQAQQQIKKTQDQYKQLKQKQVQKLSNIQMTNFDILVLKQEIEELQLQQTMLKQKYKREMKDLETEYKQQVSKWNQQYLKVQRKTEHQILEQKSKILLKRRQIEQWQRKILDKKQQIQDIKVQIKQIKENQAMAANLKQKAREMENNNGNRKQGIFGFMTD